MIAWIILMRMLCAGSMRYTQLASRAKAYTVPASVATVTMAYIVFWVGVRTSIADTATYVNGFILSSSDISQVPTILESGGKAILWNISILLFKALVTENWQVWLISLAITMGFSVSYCYYKHSEAFFFSILLFILATDFTWMLNGMRQFLCVTTLMVAFPWLVKGKTKHYMILLAVLSLIHFTVWIMAPIYFVVQQKPWSKLVILTIIGTCIICAFAAPFAGAIEDTLQHTQYKGTEIINPLDDGAHPIRVVLLAIPTVIAWFNRKSIEKENNIKLNILINLCLLSALLMLFAVFTSGIMMGRLAIYCSVYSALALPMLISRWPNKNRRQLLRIFCIIGYTAFFYVGTQGLGYISDLTGYIP